MPQTPQSDSLRHFSATTPAVVGPYFVVVVVVVPWDVSCAFSPAKWADTWESRRWATILGLDPAVAVVLDTAAVVAVVLDSAVVVVVVLVGVTEDVAGILATLDCLPRDPATSFPAKNRLIVNTG